MKLRLPKGTYMTRQAEIFEAHRLIRLGRSWALVLPKAWVELLARDGWVELRHKPETGEIVIAPLTEEKREVLNELRNRERGSRTDSPERTA